MSQKTTIKSFLKLLIPFLLVTSVINAERADKQLLLPNLFGARSTGFARRSGMVLDLWAIYRSDQKSVTIFVYDFQKKSDTFWGLFFRTFSNFVSKILKKVTLFGVSLFGSLRYFNIIFKGEHRFLPGQEDKINAFWNS